MADWYDGIDEERKRWIEAQHVFFIATAPGVGEGRYPTHRRRGATYCACSARI